MTDQEREALQLISDEEEVPAADIAPAVRSALLRAYGRYVGVGNVRKTRRKA